MRLNMDAKIEVAVGNGPFFFFPLCCLSRASSHAVRLSSFVRLRFYLYADFMMGEIVACAMAYTVYSLYEKYLSNTAQSLLR